MNKYRNPFVKIQIRHSDVKRLKALRWRRAGLSIRGQMRYPFVSIQEVITRLIDEKLAEIEHRQEETRKKMSQAKKGKPHPYMQGDKHPNWGGAYSAQAWRTRRERCGPTGMKPKETKTT